MFEVGDKVSVSKKGICKVENIAKNIFDGCEKDKLYYVLNPVSKINNMIVYLPVDTKLAMRKIISKKQADGAISLIFPENQIGEIVDGDKLSIFNKYVYSGDFFGWIKLLNSLAQLKKSNSKKIYGAFEQKQYENVFELVLNEICEASQGDREEIKALMKQKLEN